MEHGSVRPSTLQISGYGAVFDSADSQADLIAPGAFLASIAQRGLRMPLLWQHDMTEPIGRIADLREDDRGLWFRADLALSRRARDAAALIQSGALRECSIGFFPRRASFAHRDGARVRLLREVELIEISLVTLAANPAARLISFRASEAGARSIEPSEAGARSIEPSEAGARSIQPSTPGPGPPAARALSRRLAARLATAVPAL